MKIRHVGCHRIVGVLFALLVTLMPLGAEALAPKTDGTNGRDGAPAAHFDAADGVLTIAETAESEIRCAQDADGFLTLSGDGWARSANSASRDFDGALQGASVDGLRGVKMEGGGRLFVGDLAVAGELAIEARRLTLTGRVHARALRLNVAEQLTVEASAHLSAQVGVNGGEIVCEAPVVITGGTFDVSGERGGVIRISATKILQYGRLQVDGAGDAGTIAIQFAGKYSETEGARLFARSANGRGGRITFAGGKDATFFSSSTIEATGREGGTVHVLGGALKLAAARIDVSGVRGGGEILIGGDKQGANPAIANASKVDINRDVQLFADARVSGPGGRIVVWSDGDTRAAGTYRARGGAEGGDGGFIEASAKGELAYGAQADAAAAHGKAGTVLLDPKFIEVKTSGAPSIGFSELVDPHPAPAVSNSFGIRVLPLSNGNVVVVDPGDNTNGASSGAIHLFNGKTGALISMLVGAAAGDALGGIDQGGFYAGADIIDLGTNAYVISQDASAKRGALTYVNGLSGVSGTLSSSNSIIGVTVHAGGFDPGEFPASSFSGQPPYATKLSSGNYVLCAPGYNSQRGFAMFLDGSVGLPPGAFAVAQPSASNCLIGSSASDNVGRQVTDLGNGHFLIYSVNRAGGPQASGALSFGNSNTGLVGTVTTSNSVVGPNAFDNLGGDVRVLPNKNYLIVTSNFAGGQNGTTTKGAVTLCSGTTGRPVTGTANGNIDTTNTYMGAASGDRVGSSTLGGSGITILSTGKYVVASPQWKSNRGAVAVGDLVTGLFGVASPENSVVGHTGGNGSSTFGDEIGSGTSTGSPGIVPLGSGNFVIVSPSFNGFRGAVTWMNSNAPLNGDVVSSANSLIGTTGVTPGQPNTGLTADQVGLGGVVSSQTNLSFNGDGNSSTTYTITNGNYVVLSPAWSGGGDGAATINGKGAATFGTGDGGVTGEISSANSLIGATSGAGVGDGVGSGVTVLSNGNYVVRSMGFNGTRGAITWCNGTSGTTSVVDATNSLVGATASQSIAAATDPIIALSNGNYLIGVPNFTVVGNANAGAIVWGDGSTAGTRLVGSIDSVNRINGVSGDDQVGQVLKALPNGNAFAVSSSFTNGGSSAGAVTWVNGTNGRDVTGGYNPVSPTNSLVGSSLNDNVGSGYQDGYILPSGNYLISSPNWNNPSPAATDAGAVTFCKSEGTTVGVVGAGNSLVGSHNNDGIGAWSLVIILPNGNYVIGTSSWNAYAGEITVGSGTTGVKGVVDSSNSLFGFSNGGSIQDKVGFFQVATPGNGNPLNDNPRILSSGDFILITPNFHSGANTVGAATFVSGTTGQTITGFGMITAANSSVGAGPAGSAQYAVEDRINGTALVGFGNESSGKVRLLTGVGPGALTYGASASSSVTVTPSAIANMLAAGTDVVLQANTDVTFTDALTVTGSGAGKLTVQAGRSILINANITTNNGALELTANDVLASGIVDSRRDPGAGGITMADGTTIDTGTGVFNAQVLDGAGKTFTTSGGISLRTVKSNGGVLANTGISAGSNIFVETLKITGNMSANAPLVTFRALDLTTKKLTITGNLTFAASGQFTTQISGLGAGQHGQVAVNGGVNLNSTPLDATLVGGFTPSFGDVLPLIENDSTDAVSGTFGGIADGATVNISGTNLVARYKSADGLGNDVVLVAPQGPDISVILQPSAIDLINGTLLSYGNVDIGTSLTGMFDVVNAGAGLLNLTGNPKVAVTGTDATQFIVTTQPGSPLAGGASSAFTVQFLPTSPGQKTAKISIANDDPDEDPFELDLIGTGMDVTLLPTLTAPVSGSTVPAFVPLTFTLPEAAFPGTVNLLFDNGVTQHGFTLGASEETAGAHNVLIDTVSNGIANGVYSITLAYQDALGNAFASTTNTNITIRPPNPLKNGLVTLGGGSKFASFGTPQTGVFAGVALVGKKKLASIFTADGTPLLQVGSSNIIKLGAPSGNAVLATLKTGAGVTAKNNVILATGLSTGTPVAAAQTGTALPGMPTGVTIKKFMAIDGNGSTTFALVTLQGTGIKAPNDLALWAVHAGGNVTIVASEGQDVTIGADTRQVKTLATFVGSKGTLAANRWRVDGDTFGIRVTFADKQQAIFAVPSNAVTAADWTLLTQTGPISTIPALNGTTVSTFGLPAFGSASVAQLLNLAKGAGVVPANNVALTSGNSTNGFKQLARKGGEIPDETGATLGGVFFKTLADPVSGANGAAAFAGTFTGARKGSGLWFAADGTTAKLIARTGTDAGALAPGGGHWKSFGTMMLPGDGIRGPVFIGKLATNKADNVTAKNNLGIWAVDSTGTLRLMLRTGRNATVNGVEKEVKTFTALVPTAGSIGTASGYDNAGNIAALATFTDGTQAMLVVTVP